MIGPPSMGVTGECRRTVQIAAWIGVEYLEDWESIWYREISWHPRSCQVFPGELCHKPSIYLSIFSHCVFPVDIKYRICVISVTPLFLSNSSLANRRVSSLVLLSEIFLDPRTIVRHNANALPRCRK